MKWEPIIPTEGDSPWDLAIRCDALYECPKDAHRKRLGPLVPYAGKDSRGRNLVGDVYFNFAKIEEHLRVVQYFAQLIRMQIIAPHMDSDIVMALRAATIVGIPDGGRTLGQMLAFEYCDSPHAIGKRFVYPVKVPRPKVEGAIKDEYDLVFKRLELSDGELVFVCDDVMNNFNNTDVVLDAIGKTGAEVVGLCCALNRSPVVDSMYVPKIGKFAGKPLPVVSVIRKPLPEYEQDDPAVAYDFNSGNIELKVKDNWARLKEIMLKASSPKNG